MKRERLDRLALDGVSLDTETHLSQPGLAAPPLVCGSIAMGGPYGELVQLYSKRELLDAFRELLGESRWTLIGAHISYDVIVIAVYAASLGIDLMPEICRMYDPTQGAVLGQVDGRVMDVLMTEKLHAIAHGYLNLDPRTMKKIINPETGKQGRYSLAAVVSQVLGRDDAKANHSWRKSFALLEHLPIEQYPQSALDYMRDDAHNPYNTALAQAGLIENVGVHLWVSTPRGQQCSRCGTFQGGPDVCRSRYRRDNTHEISRQTYFEFCVELGATWGFAVDQQAVNDLEARYNAEHQGQLQPFVDLGIIRADGTENRSVLKRLIAQAYECTAPCQHCALTRDKHGNAAPGKVPSVKTQGKTLVNCEHCDGTGLNVDNCPKSDKGGIAFGQDTLQQSGNETLMALGDYKLAQKIPDVYIPYLRNFDADDVPHTDVPRILRPNSIVETGRVSYDGATMLLPRHGGVRECLVARDGYLLSSEDYRAGELVTHAQSCIWIVGDSELARVLNQGFDAHTALAGTVLGLSYKDIKQLIKDGDKRCKNARQTSKPPNFGFPGRMGAFKLVWQQRKQNDVHTPHPSGPTWLDDGKGGKVRGYKGLRFCLLMNRADRCGEVMISEWKGREYGVRLCKKCVECAQDLRVAWLKQWPENKKYFDRVKEDDDSGLPIVQHVTKRLRGFRQGVLDEDGEPINSGNAIANGYFQALLADAAKNAYMAATRECIDHTVRVRSYTKHTSRYEGGPSPLYGSHLTQFQHDEIIGEHPRSEASDAARRISEIGKEALRLMCPDMDQAVEMEPTLMPRMYKGAVPVWFRGGDQPADDDDVLLPWEPKKKIAA